MPDLISLDRFRAELRTGNRPAAAVYRLQVSDAIEVAGAERTLRWCFSDGTLDLVGDTIDPDGWDTDDYLRNPVVLWAHDSWSPPIGRASNLLVAAARLTGDIEFASAEIYPFADTIYRLAQAKFINAGSVGFLPIDFDFAHDEDRDFGIDFKRQKLLEFSLCPVPANPNALAEARAKGIDTRPIVEWAEKLLDGGGRVILPKAEVEALRRSALEPRPPHRRAAEEWHVGASRDLPLDDSDGWDGPAAAKRMLDAAGFDGDSPDSAKARRGFLLYDGTAPHLHGSYKEPFADIVGGICKAVKGGIRAAASRLPQTDAPQSVRDDARAVIDHYEERFGMGKSATPRLRADGGGMSGGDPSSGGYLATCGRAADEACGMKDPAECAVHGPLISDKALIAAAVREGVKAALGELRGAPPAYAAEAPLHLKHARGHVKAAHDHHQDLQGMAPDGEPDLGDDGVHDAVLGMHAHVKAADGYMESYRALVGLPNLEGERALRLRQLKAPAPGDPHEHLRHAREHVKAAHEHLKDLITIDPEGDEDLAGHQGAQDAVRGMHAHIKAADGYLERCRSIGLPLPTGYDGGERAVRMARLAQLA